MTITEPFLTILPADADALAEKDQATYQAILNEVETVTSVQEAREKHEAACDRVAKLKAAHLAMNRRGKELFDRVSVAQAALETGLVEQYADSGAPVDAAGLFADYTVAQGERDAVMCGLARLMEHVKPLAEIAQLKAEATLFMGRADQLKRIVQERISKTVELMRGAAEFESGIVMDTRSTISGQLLAYAEALQGRSVEAALAANEQERAYNRANAPKLQIKPKGANLWIPKS
jgi:hypothetical protein